MKTYNTILQCQNQIESDLLIKSLEMKRNAFNIISKIRFDMKKNYSLKALHDKCYYKVKEAVPGIPSQFIIKAEQDVVSKYCTIRSNHNQIEDAPQTNKLSITLDKRIYKWTNTNEIKLTTYDKRIFCTFNIYPKLAEMLKKYKIRDPSLFVKNNKVYLSIMFDDSILFKDNKKVIGVDLGIKRLIATSEGIVVKGHEFNAAKRKIRWKKRKLQSKQNHSHSARRKLLRLRKKEKNYSKNYVHHLANSLLKTKANTIVFEDLTGIKKKKHGRGFNDRQGQIPYFLLRTISTYKAQSLGKRVEMVKPYFTSQYDFRGIESGVRKGARYYGSDGVVLDADLNAANNIALKYDKKHSITCSALDGQAVINRPIVGPYTLANSQLNVSG